MHFSKGLVSIIVPAYNREKLIINTLESIMHQTYTKWECIIVDDGSTDNTINVILEFAKRDNRFKHYKRPSHLPKGAPSCRNYGFEMSTGEFIQWFDSDDLMLPEMLEEKVKALSESPDLDFVVSKMGEIDENRKVTYPNYECDSKNRIEDFLNYKIKFLTPGPLFRKNFLYGRILFSEYLPRNQEWEFFSGLVIEGCNYKLLNKFHCLRLLHSESINSIYTKKKNLELSYFRMIALKALTRRVHPNKMDIIKSVFYRKVIRFSYDSLKTMNFKYFSLGLNLIVKLF